MLHSRNRKFAIFFVVLFAIVGGCDNDENGVSIPPGLPTIAVPTTPPDEALFGIWTFKATVDTQQSTCPDELETYSDDIFEEYRFVRKEGGCTVDSRTENGTQLTTQERLFAVEKTTCHAGEKIMALEWSLNDKSGDCTTSAKTTSRLELNNDKTSLIGTIGTLLNNQGCAVNYNNCTVVATLTGTRGQSLNVPIQSTPTDGGESGPTSSGTSGTTTPPPVATATTGAATPLTCPQGAQPSRSGAECVALFPDQNLATAIRRQLNLTANDELTLARLQSLTELDAITDSGLTNVITNLAGIEFSPNLQSLNLPGHRIQDIQPLIVLTRLTSLSLSHNHNPITDFSPLSQLVRLTALYLDNTNISDLSVLIPLTQLSKLKLNNHIFRRDFSPLQQLPRLVELELKSNDITDLAQLPKLVSLRSLVLDGNNIQNLPLLSTNFPNLTTLLLQQCNIVNTEQIPVLSQLQKLSLNLNPITNFRGLKRLTTLTSLNLGGTRFQDLATLSPLVNLQELFLHGNRIQDLRPLSNFSRLMHLEVDINVIHDFGPLTGLPQLQKLAIARNPGLVQTNQNYPLNLSVINELKRRGVKIIDPRI